MSRASAFLEQGSFTAPKWSCDLNLVPDEFVKLGIMPTPIHKWNISGVPDGVEMFIKRDDLSGMQLSGNKVRKLEFLMAEAKRGGHDSIITIGGIQSNHCRATATAATYLGMEAHLVLRNTEHAANGDPGLVGNLLVSRLQGAHIHQVSKADYTMHGSEALTTKLADDLRIQGKRPYVIPVGGSNALGCWGYMMALEEIREQSKEQPFTHIVMACGSGATTAGLALGNHLSGYNAKVMGYGVCDDEEYFYDFIDSMYAGLGAAVSAKNIVSMRQSKGAGYAISRSDELQTTMDIAMSTGVVLDPVYSGKAMHGLLADMQADPQAWTNARVLFIHTGGLLGMYDKADQIQGMIANLDRAHRLDLTALKR